MRTDPELIAARLGIDTPHVQRLQARGHLTRLELSDAEIRERLYTAHVHATLAQRPGASAARGGLDGGSRCEQMRLGAARSSDGRGGSRPEHRVVGP